jgi:hypothetical protein
MRSKLKPFAIHLAISLAVAFAAYLYVRLVLYPGSLFEVMRASGLIGLLLFVDVVLGPLVTSIIYDAHKSKKALTLDFVVVGALQLSALIYGFSVVLKAAPAYVVFDGLRFDVVNHVELSANKDAKNESLKLPFSGPKIVAAELPKDRDLSLKVLAAGMQGVNVSAFPQLYIEYDHHKNKVAVVAESIEGLSKRNIAAAGQIQNQLRSEEREKVSVLPAKVGDHRMAALVASKSGEFVRLVNVDVW